LCKVFGTKVTLDGVAQAIATFAGMVVSGYSAFGCHEDAVEESVTEAQSFIQALSLPMILLA
jgi:hypothetical protein|tara:strand:+ start:1199 stop:1384 length:186 start_codon:yes stop_codon:yes gene_type:complete